MNLQQQQEFIENFFADAAHVVRNRRSDYAPDGIVLLNVLASCVQWEQTPVQVLGVLLDKQTTALQALCKLGKVDSDPPRSRLVDSANYFAFFAMYLTHADVIHTAWYHHWIAQPCRCLEPPLDNEDVCVRCKTLIWLDNHARQTR